MRRLCLVPLFVLLASPVWAEDFYFTQAGAGTQSGDSCPNALPASFFNTAANWSLTVPDVGKINPGDTAHICGTWTGVANDNFLRFQGSGTAGNVISLVFETGAILEAPYFAFGSFGTNGGAIDLKAKSHILVDGGATCGVVSGVEVPIGSCNGIIRNTDNGTNLTYKGTSDAGNVGKSQGIYNFSGTPTDVEIRNVVMDLYRRVDPNSNDIDPVTPGIQFACGTNCFDGRFVYGIYFDRSAVSDILVHHNRVEHAMHTIQFNMEGVNGDNVQIYNNYVSDQSWGITIGGYGDNTFTTNIQIHDNEVSDWHNWITHSNVFHSNGIFMFHNCPMVVNNQERRCGIGDASSNIYNNYVHGTLYSPDGTLGSPSGLIQASTNSLFNIFNNRLHVPANGAAFNIYILGCDIWPKDPTNNCGGGIKVFNNTVVVESGSSKASPCIYVTGNGTTPHTVKNNLCVNSRPLFSIEPIFATAGGCTELFTDDGIFISDYNLAYQSPSGYWIADNYCGPATSKTLTQWQGAPWLQDVNSVIGNPNLDANDRLQTGSAAVGVGVNLTSLGITALNTDADGNARHATNQWDIGAFNLVVEPPAQTAEDIYIAPAAAGTDSGENCANAHGAPFFNDDTKWSAEVGMINAGDTVHVCDTWTGGDAAQLLSFQGSGESGNPITLVFETGAVMQPSYCAPTGCINYNGNSYILIDGGTTCGIVTKWTTTTCNGHIQNYAVGSVTRTCPNSLACVALASSVISVGIGNSTGTPTNNTVRNMKLGPFYTRDAADTTSNGMGTACLSVQAGFTEQMPLDQSICTGVARGYYITLAGTLPGNLSGYTLSHVSFSDQCRAVDVSANSTGGDVSVSISDSEITDWDKWAPSSGCSTFTTALFNGSALQQSVGRVLFSAANNYFHGDMTGGVVTSSQWGLLACGTNCILTGFNNRLVSTCTGATPTRTCSPAIKLNSVGPGGHQLYQNTIHGAGAGVTLLITGTLTANPIFKNNVVYNMGSGVSITPNNQSLTSNYNNMNLVTADWITLDTAGTPVSKTLAQWQASPYLQDLTSATGDPLLDANDLLQAGSPAINTGVNLTDAMSGINVDAANVARPSLGAWDMGAFDDVGVGGTITAPVGVRLANTNPITIIWAPNTEALLAGYRIYERTDAGAYGARIKDITPASAAAAHSPVTRYIRRVLTPGITWWAVTAFDSNGVESDFSQVSTNVTGLAARGARQ